ncbi:hypothetical protein DPMN_161923 [Dreissena polymorpha]|uniref:Uncharacterized protein n=1 Tax=Dreissena polymorpha TaxID=45954 RepID=A0A9D4ERC0_DREPO|nr:hypothetical protein DPMN_161923 [Dreissena polymorpha]
MKHAERVCEWRWIIWVKRVGMWVEQKEIWLEYQEDGEGYVLGYLARGIFGRVCDWRFCGWIMKKGYLHEGNGMWVIHDGRVEHEGRVGYVNEWIMRHEGMGIWMELDDRLCGCRMKKGHGMWVKMKHECWIIRDLWFDHEEYRGRVRVCGLSMRHKHEGRRMWVQHDIMVRDMMGMWVINEVGRGTSMMVMWVENKGRGGWEDHEGRHDGGVCGWDMTIGYYGWSMRGMLVGNDGYEGGKIRRMEHERWVMWDDGRLCGWIIRLGYVDGGKECLSVESLSRECGLRMRGISLKYVTRIMWMVHEDTCYWWNMVVVYFMWVEHDGSLCGWSMRGFRGWVCGCSIRAGYGMWVVYDGRGMWMVLVARSRLYGWIMMIFGRHEGMVMWVDHEGYVCGCYDDGRLGIWFDHKCKIYVWIIRAHDNMVCRRIMRCTLVDHECTLCGRSIRGKGMWLEDEAWGMGRVYVWSTRGRVCGLSIRVDNDGWILGLSIKKGMLMENEGEFYVLEHDGREYILTPRRGINMKPNG